MLGNSFLHLRHKPARGDSQSGHMYIHRSASCFDLIHWLTPLMPKVPVQLLELPHMIGIALMYLIHESPQTEWNNKQIETTTECFLVIIRKPDSG